MHTAKSLIVAAAVVFIGNVSFAKDGLVPSKRETEKPIGIITVKVGEEVKAFALSKEHKAIFEESKKLAQELEDGKAKETNDDVIANQKAINVLVGISPKDGEEKPSMAKGVELVGTTKIESTKLDQISSKSVKACWRGGYGYRGGFSNYYAYGGFYGYGGGFGGGYYGGYYGGNCGGYIYQPIYGCQPCFNYGYGAVNYSYGYSYGYGGYGFYGGGW